MKNKFFAGSKRFGESRFTKKGHLSHYEKLDKNWFNDNTRFSNSAKLENLWFKSEDIFKLNFLLKSGVDINTRNSEGCTTLFDSENKKSQFLISKGIDVNALSMFGKNALFTATNNEKMKILIDAGIDIHQKDKRGANILLKMAVDQNEQMFTYLLEKGVSSEFYFSRLLFGVMKKDIEFHSFLKDYHEPFYKLVLIFQEKSRIRESLNSLIKENVTQNSKKRM